LATLHRERVSSVAALQQAHGPFDAVVVAAGAAVGALGEAPLRALPLQLCQVRQVGRKSGGQD